MADYVPNTVVYVCKNVPLDDTYTDTRWFDSAGEQAGFFQGLAVKIYRDMTYQRVNNGIAQPRVALTCRVPDIADNLYDCNYMMFQNSNYGDKWFYAFIKQVNYINPNNTELVYEIDYLQTFMFQLKIKASFVEREHATAAEDKAFANLTPEPVGVSNWCADTGNYYRCDLTTLGLSNSPKIIMGVIPDDALTTIILGQGDTYSGIYSGVSFIEFNSADTCNAMILAIGAAGYSQNIVGIWMAPAAPRRGDRATPVAVATSIAVNGETFNTEGGAYTIRNKKLLNSQFTYIKGTSDSGEEMVWKPEFVGGVGFSGTFNGQVSVCYTPNFSMVFTPNYMGWHGANVATVEYALPFSQQVQCIWSGSGWLGDTVKSGLKLAAMMMLTAGVAGAVGGAAIAESASSSAISTAAGSTVANAALQTTKQMATTGMQMGGGTGTIPLNPVVPLAATYGPSASIAPGALSQISRMSSMLPAHRPLAKGSFIGDEMAFSMGLHGFQFRRMCATKDELEKLDTFFDMFGYQVNKVKVPNLHARQSWDYVKLNTPCIYGSVPVEGMAIIKAAFSNGIRLWHVNAVGDYSIQNPPV